MVRLPFLIDVYGRVGGYFLSSMSLCSQSIKEASRGQVSFSVSGSVTLGTPFNFPFPHLKIRSWIKQSLGFFPTLTSRKGIELLSGEELGP